MQNIKEYSEANPELIRAVVGFCIQDGNVLLGVRKKTGLGLGLNLIAGIGGKVGDIPEFEMETHEDALIRELQEEIGVKITSFHNVGNVVFYFPYKPKWNQTVAIYTIDKWEDVPLETDVIQPQWYNQTELPFQNMWDDAQYWIPLILENKRIDAFFLYGEDNTTVIDSQINIIS